MKERFAAISLVLSLMPILSVECAAAGVHRGSGSPVAIDAPADIAKIRKILEDMTVAQNGAQFGEAFADDVIYYDLMEDSAFGKEQFLKHIARQFAPLRNIHTRILDVHIHTNGSFGYSVSTQNFLSDTANGQKVDQIFRETDVFQKRRGRWVIVHQHLSMPFAMEPDFKSGKTLFNSTATLPAERR